MVKTVRLFSTASCPYCVMAKKFLEENKINFQYIDVSKDKAAAMEMMQISGQMGVPVIQIDETVIVGFDVQAMKRALGLK